MGRKPIDCNIRKVAIQQALLGRSKKEIAGELGIHWTSIYGWLKEDEAVKKQAEKLVDVVEKAEEKEVA